MGVSIRHFHATCYPAVISGQYAFPRHKRSLITKLLNNLALDVTAATHWTASIDQSGVRKLPGGRELILPNRTFFQLLTDLRNVTKVRLTNYGVST